MNEDHEKKWEEDFVEKGADLEHTRWARWQNYLHSKCIFNEDGSLTIPAHSVMHWSRQINTPYADLSEAEKESDRKEVRQYLPLIREQLSLASAAGRQEATLELTPVAWKEEGREEGRSQIIDELDTWGRSRLKNYTDSELREKLKQMKPNHS